MADKINNIKVKMTAVLPKGVLADLEKNKVYTVACEEVWEHDGGGRGTASVSGQLRIGVRGS